MNLFLVFGTCGRPAVFTQCLVVYVGGKALTRTAQADTTYIRSYPRTKVFHVDAMVDGQAYRPNDVPKGKQPEEYQIVIKGNALGPDHVDFRMPVDADAMYGREGVLAVIQDAQRNDGRRFTPGKAMRLVEALPGKTRAGPYKGRITAEDAAQAKEETRQGYGLERLTK